MNVTHYEGVEMRLAKKFVTLEQPDGIWVAEWPTLEAAQAFALACNEWLDACPEPTTVEPFFRMPELVEALDLEERAHPSRLDQILDDMLAPEEMADAVLAGMEARQV